MKEEEYSEYTRNISSVTTIIEVMNGFVFIVLTLILLFADTTKPIVGLVLFFLLLSGALLGYCAGSFMTTAFTYIRHKPEATAEIKAGNSVFLFAQVLWSVALDLMFLIKDLVYHFTVAVTLTIIIYGVLAAYVFPKAYKGRI